MEQVWEFARSCRERGFFQNFGMAKLCKRWILPLLLLAVWQSVTGAGWVRPMLLPSPVQVAAAALDMTRNGELAIHLGASILRVLEGFAVATVLGISLGLSLGLSATFFEMMNGLLQLLRPIPPIAWLPLAILWLGIEEGSKIFIIVIGAFFPIFINVLDGVRQTDGKYVELAQVFEVSWRRFVAKVVLPGALPYILAGLRIGLGYAWMCVVAAELSAGMRGMGYLLTDARALAQTDKVLAGMLIIGVIGKTMDSLLKLLEPRLIRWKKSFDGV